MLLEVDGLYAGYDSSEVLHGISLRVDDAGLAILGPNGAGKTTLLRILSGLLRPRAGSIRFQGISLERMSIERIAQLGVVHVPQGRRILSSMTVRENLQLAGYLLKDSKEEKRRFQRIMEVFPRLRVALGRKGSQISGGEQQMLAIARAVMMPSVLIMLDEPSDGLAPIVIEELASLLREIRTAFSVSLLLVEQKIRGWRETRPSAVS